MEKKPLTLDFIWGIRRKLYAEGSNLQVEGSKLYAEGSKLQVEGSKLYAEGSKLQVEGNKLWAEGVQEAYGNIKLEWKNFDRQKNSHECHLETGEVFKP